MARSQTSRFSLWRWPSDSDTQGRSDFDSDNNQLETLAAIALKGTKAARPAASVRERLYLATDEQLVYWDNGTAWVPVGPRGFIAEIASVTSVDLSGGGSSGSGNVEVVSSRYTVPAQPTQRRYKLTTTMRFNAGGVPVLFRGGAMQGGTVIDSTDDDQVLVTTTGGPGQESITVVETALVAASTSAVFSAYGRRFVSSGNAGDSVVATKLLIEDIGGI